VYARTPEVTHGEFEVPTAPSLGIEFGITNDEYTTHLNTGVKKG